MNVHFGMVNTGHRPLDNGYAPLYYLELGETRLFMHPKLQIFFELPIDHVIRVSLHEEEPPEKFLQNRLPMMLAAAERDERKIDEEQVRRFLSYLKPKPAVVPRTRERTRPAPQVTPRIRERSRGIVITGQTNVVVEESDLVPASPPPAPRIRTRTRG